MQAVPSQIEIERKYLLNALPQVCAVERPLRLEQGYLPSGGTIFERVTRFWDPIRYGRNVKVRLPTAEGEALKRYEFQEPLHAITFERLWRVTEGRRIHKQRFRMQHHGHTWELDEYLDRTLFIAEIELADEQSEVALPGWLSRYVVRQVTSDPAFEGFQARRIFFFVTHAGPDVGGHQVRAAAGIGRIVEHGIADIGGRHQRRVDVVPFGVDTLRWKPNTWAACSHEYSMLLASPIQATVLPAIEPRCSM